MAFTSSITFKRRIIGGIETRYDTRMVEVFGTFSQAGSDTGGEINTQLTSISHIQLTPSGAAGDSDLFYSTSASMLTVTTSTGPTGGSWYAIGTE